MQTMMATKAWGALPAFRNRLIVAARNAAVANSLTRRSHFISEKVQDQLLAAFKLSSNLISMILIP